MRIPHFIGGYVDLDGDGIFGIGPAPLAEMLNPALLTFPLLGEYQDPIAAPADYSPRPFAVTVDNAIEWLYRVRQWQAEVEIPSGPGSEFGVVTIDLDDPRAPSNELAFICTEPGHSVLTFYGESSVADVGDRSFSANVTLDLFVRINEGENPYDALQELEPYHVGTCTNTSTAQMLVTMRIRTSITVYDNVSLEQWDATTDSWDDQELDEYTNEAVTMDGELMMTRWPWIGFTSGGITYLESAPYVTVSPNSWWEYRDADNANPIWNASTGAQLRSVLTGEEL